MRSKKSEPTGPGLTALTRIFLGASSLAMSVTLVLNDKGHTGEGGPLEARAFVQVAVQAVADVPMLTPSPQTKCGAHESYVPGPIVGREDENIYILRCSFQRSGSVFDQIFDENMSRRHAAVRVDDMRFELSDLKSTNGVFVNGRRITKIFLKDGDQIRLGHTTLAFKLIR